MEYTIVNMTDKNVNDLTEYFDRIVLKIIERLDITQPYCFSVIFIDDKKIKEINNNYRHKNTVTDVISFAALDGAEDFELDIEEIELGDIFISVEAIERQAKEYGHSVIREASFLFTHGLLHLLGYDHQDTDGEITMFNLQDIILDDIIKR